MAVVIRPTARNLGELCTWAVAPLALAAGLVHLAAAADHTDHRLVAAFFVAVAAAQVVFAALAWKRPVPAVLGAGALGG